MARSKNTEQQEVQVETEQVEQEEQHEQAQPPVAVPEAHKGYVEPQEIATQVGALANVIAGGAIQGDALELTLKASEGKVLATKEAKVFICDENREHVMAILSGEPSLRPQFAAAAVEKVVEGRKSPEYTKVQAAYAAAAERIEGLKAEMAELVEMAAELSAKYAMPFDASALLSFTLDEVQPRSFGKGKKGKSGKSGERRHYIWPAIGEALELEGEKWFILNGAREKQFGMFRLVHEAENRWVIYDWLNRPVAEAEDGTTVVKDFYEKTDRSRTVNVPGAVLGLPYTID